MVGKLAAFGVSLTSFGSLFAYFSYFMMGNIPLTSLGVGCIILGLSILLTPPHPIPRRVVRALIESSVFNLEALLEEFDVKGRGYYFLGGGGRVQVYVPISSDVKPPPSTAELRGVVVEVEGTPYLVFYPPASGLIESEGYGDLEAAISGVLVDLTELCSSVRVVRGVDIMVEARGCRSRIGAGRFKRVFGSIEACLAACVSAILLKRPVYVASEVERGDDKIISLRVVE